MNTGRCRTLGKCKTLADSIKPTKAGFRRAESVLEYLYDMGSQQRSKEKFYQGAKVDDGADAVITALADQGISCSCTPIRQAGLRTDKHSCVCKVGKARYPKGGRR